MGHHKSNKQVAGDPLSGHGGGLPLRPDAADLDERMQADRLAAGFPALADLSPDAVYAEELEVIDRQTRAGELRQDQDVPRRDRAFPTTRYE